MKIIFSKSGNREREMSYSKSSKIKLGFGLLLDFE